jgi:hypothetical protein
MNPGWSLPVVSGRRGAGLGNEVIPWAKAYLAAQALGLRTVHPAWALNRRGYRHDFGTSRLDWLVQSTAAAALPSVDLSWERIRSTGEQDYGLAVRALRGELGLDRRPLVVRNSSGMAGGYLAVRRARTFLLSRVLSPDHVTADLGRIAERWDDRAVRVAVHVRAGDFEPGGPGPGQFNRAVPDQWYVAVCRSLRAELGDGVGFLVLSEGDGAAARRLVAEVAAVTPPTRHRPLLSDIAAMAQADLLVCSVSSMSMFAAFLSGAHYVWYAPQLETSAGWRSIWGLEPEQRAGATARNRSAGAPAPPLARGVPVDDDGRVPVDLVRRLREQAAIRDARHDLLLYGVVR